jgi:hypothetical protein
MFAIASPPGVIFFLYPENVGAFPASQQDGNGANDAFAFVRRSPLDLKRRGKIGCLVASRLAMTVNSKHTFPTRASRQTQVRASRRDAPESCIYLPPLGGRGECRVPVAPAASCALCIGGTHTSNNEYTGIARHSRTQWF